jgi:16S rRNA (guanine(527)-N(7))-methyltransferase RsmG
MRSKTDAVAAEIARLRSALVADTPANQGILAEMASAPMTQSIRAIELLKRPELSYQTVLKMIDLPPMLDFDQAAELEIEVKYDGYVKRQTEAIERFRRLEDAPIPEWVDFDAVTGLSTEAKERLSNLRPRSLGQAARMPGITPRQSRYSRFTSNRSVAADQSPSELATFHVKRTSPDAAVDPARTAKSVRHLVEVFMHTNPSVIGSEFPECIEKLAITLVQWGSKMNLTAHPEDPEEVAFHVIDCVMPVVLGTDKSSALAGEFTPGRKILDLGSGAGFPGLVLAAASPGANFTLVESRRKRASFLQVAMAEMALKNAVIEVRRAEDIGLAGQYDMVTARAFGDTAEIIHLVAKALRPGGLAMLYANPSQRVNWPNHQRIEYRVQHRSETIRRILAVWRKE